MKSGHGSKLLSVKRKAGTKNKHSFEPKERKIETPEEREMREKKEKKEKRDKKYKKGSASKRLKGT